MSGFFAVTSFGTARDCLILPFFLRKIFRQRNDLFIYFTRNRKGDPLKSTTIPIQGDKGNIIGLICVNFYLNSPLSALIEDLTPKDETHREETFLSASETGAEQLYELMTAVRDEVFSDGDIPYNCRNKEIVQRLNAQGAFTRKSAVKTVSDFLGISKNTIYLHIRNAEK